MKEDKVKMCVEENRDKGEIKETKGEENVGEKKTEKKKKKKMLLCWFGYTCGVGQGHEHLLLLLLFLSKLMKKKLY